MADETPSDKKPSDKAPSEDPGSAAARRRTWRRRLAFPVLVIGAVILVAYYSRTKPVEVTVTYDLGSHASRVSRLSASFQKNGKKVSHPVEWTFPAGVMTQRRHRHKLTLKPGTYTVRARLHLRASGAQPAEVRKVQRSIEIATGQDQRITLRFR